MYRLQACLHLESFVSITLKALCDDEIKHLGLSIFDALYWLVGCKLLGNILPTLITGEEYGRELLEDALIHEDDF